MVEIKILYFGRVFPINGEGSAFLIETTAIHSDSQRNQAAVTASLPLRATWKTKQGGCHDNDCIQSSRQLRDELRSMR
jgi:hypothetical protein